MTETTERFLRYVKIDTQSEEGHESTPSTEKQFDLARLLVRELNELGAEDVFLDEDLCYVYAKIPANTSSSCPKLGFIAHMDTSPAVSDENVSPVITENYDGSPIKMGNSGLTLSPDEYPSLLNYKGQTIICTDGNTLLGGDDKGTDLDELIACVHDHAAVAVCFGAAGPRFFTAFEQARDAAPADFSLLRANHLEDALDVALRQVKPGEVVLLSPACASFDEFTSFEQRGDVFKRLVAERARNAETQE